MRLTAPIEKECFTDDLYRLIEKDYMEREEGNMYSYIA